MAFTEITTEQIAVGKPVTNSLLTTIKDDLDDHETRISAIAGGSVVQIFNQIFRMPEIPVGSAIWNWDTTANLNLAGLGSNWVTASGAGQGTWDDGASVNHNVPDATDRFLRMASTYAAVNVTDTVANSTAKPASFAVDSGGSHSHTIPGNVVGQQGAASNASTLQPANQNTISTNSAGAHIHSATGWDAETAPDHIRQNLVFKKEYSYGEKIMLFRSANSMAINNVVLAQLEAGSAGDVTIDIEVGTLAQLSADTLTSIFDVVPTLNFSAGNFSEDTGTINSGNAAVAVNDYIKLTISGIQTGQGEFFIQCTGA